MFAVLRPFWGWQKKIVAGILAWLVTAMVPCVVAGDSLELVRLFQKNTMPGSGEIRTSYANFSYKPYERQELYFSILIPNNEWRDLPVSIEPETIQQDTEQLIPLAKQMAPENEKGEAKIEVAYMRMSREIDLYDYVQIFLENNKEAFDLLMRRKGHYNMRTVDELLLASEQNAKSYVARLTFSRHGDRIFLVSGSALESEFERYAENFTAAAVSFTPVESSPDGYAEKMATFTSTGTPRMQFDYPEPWTCAELRELPVGRTGVDIKLRGRNDEDQTVSTYGYIHVSAFSGENGTAPDQILADVKKDFQHMPISLDQCILKADVQPELTAPLGKLERWNGVAKGKSGEAGFLVLPRGDDFIVMGLFTMRPEDNLLTWSHTWRVFEIIANDLIPESIDLSAIKHRTLPAKNQLKNIVADTMNDFVQAVGKGNFDDFYNRISTLFKVQITPARLYAAFKGFASIKELEQFQQHAPIFKEGICIDKDGMLEVSGHYPMQPQATAFRLSYIQEQNDWKLLGIHVVMQEMPSNEKQPPEEN